MQSAFPTTRRRRPHVFSSCVTDVSHNSHTTAENTTSVCTEQLEMYVAARLHCHNSHPGAPVTCTYLCRKVASLQLTRPSEHHLKKPVFQNLQFWENIDDARVMPWSIIIIYSEMSCELKCCQVFRKVQSMLLFGRAPHQCLPSRAPGRSRPHSASRPIPCSRFYSRACRSSQGTMSCMRSVVRYIQ